LTDDTFPAFDSTKKQKTTDTVDTEAMTTTDTLITVDLDEIDEKREALRSELQKEITSLRQEMTIIRKELREDFMTQVGKMELCIEQNMKPMMKDFHARVKILTVNIQAVADSVAAHADVNDAKFDRILEAIKSLGKCSLPTPHGTQIRNADKKPRAITTNTATHDPMTIISTTMGLMGASNKILQLAEPSPPQREYALRPAHPNESAYLRHGGSTAHVST
jgi:hypothetical protein